MSRESQADRLLLLLSGKDYSRYEKPDAEGWVPLPVILRLGIACHTRRIHELRKKGYVIELRDERIDGQRHTAYRLVK